MLRKLIIPFYCALVLSSHVSAMDSTSPIKLEPPPENPAYDEAGVDLMSGLATISLKDLSIGNGVSALSHTISTYGNIMYGFLDDFYVEMNRDSTYPAHQWWVAALGQTHRFNKTSAGVYQNLSGDGATLQQTGAHEYTLTKSDGTQVIFQRGIVSSAPQKFIYPNGLVVTKHLFSANRPDGSSRTRVQSITTNTGLQFKYFYATNTIASSSAQATDSFSMPIKITAVNNTEKYCSPTAHSCSLDSTWPSVNYTWPTHSQITGTADATSIVTDADGRQTRYVHRQYVLGHDSSSSLKEARIHKVIGSTSTGASTVEYDYAHATKCGTGEFMARLCDVVMRNIVSKARIDGKEWKYNYSYPDTDYYAGSGSSIGPNGTISLWKDSLYTKRTIRDRVVKYDGTIVDYSRDEANRIERVGFPDGFTADFQYTSSGIIKKRSESANGITGAVTEAGFATCTSSNQYWCKTSPIWVEDARGFRTEYEYSDAHGMMTKVTQPAPSAGKPRPETRFEYGQHYAWYRKTSNSVTRADSPVWLLEKESTCATGAASGNGCADPNDEVITRYEYGSGSSSSPNNLWLRGTVVDSYNPHTGQREVRRTCYQYDTYGNRIAETQANAKLASCS